MPRRLLLLPSMVVLLAACATGPLEPSATPTLPSTPTLRPVDDFVTGESDVPDGMFLFIENFTVNDGASTGDINTCPGGMIDFPGYQYADGTLDISRVLTDPELDIWRGMADDGSLIGFAGQGQANEDGVGGGVASVLLPIQEVPFAFPDGGPIILAVYADGTIVAKIGVRSYLLGPGEAWVSRTDSYPFPDCHTWSVTRFTNFGLLPREAIPRLQ